MKILQCWGLIGGLALALAAGQASARVIYVKVGGAGLKNGQSWANAYDNPKPATAAAQAGDELWVAAGTYKPTSGNDRGISFVMKFGVAMYGGFGGFETAREQRNWTARKTILSGELGSVDAADNTFHVVFGADGAVLDGFTVTGGYTLESGGGMVIEGGALTIANCSFTHNFAAKRGGGMYDTGCVPAIDNCLFEFNRASQGGAIYSENSSLTLTRCKMEHNYGSTLWDSLVNVNSFVTMRDTTIMLGNVTNTRCTGSFVRCDVDGADTYWHNGNSSMTVTDCTFGNAFVSNWGSSITFTNCTFGDDDSRILLCGMGNGGNAVVAVSNCLFIEGAGLSADGCLVTVDQCDFIRNKKDYGGAILSKNATVTVTNCSLQSNRATAGGAVSITRGRMIINGCVFFDNSALDTLTEQRNGGAVQINDALSSVSLIGNTFYGNIAGVNGGAISKVDGSVEIVNCIFKNNSVKTENEFSKGGAICNVAGPVAVANCTFSVNSGSTGGAIYQAGAGPMTVVNSILWNNPATQDAEVHNTGNNLTFYHCDIRGSGGSGAGWKSALGADGGGNIASDPLFVDLAKPAGVDGLWMTGDDGLRLKNGSPCIGAGQMGGAPGGDILGTPRLGFPDLGAYEMPGNAAWAWGTYQ